MVGIEFRPDEVLNIPRFDKFDINGKRGWFRQVLGVRIYWCDREAVDRIADLLPLVAKAEANAKQKRNGITVIDG